MALAIRRKKNGPSEFLEASMDVDQEAKGTELHDLNRETKEMEVAAHGPVISFSRAQQAKGDAGSFDKAFRGSVQSRERTLAEEPRSRKKKKLNELSGAYAFSNTAQLPRPIPISSKVQLGSTPNWMRTGVQSEPVWADNMRFCHPSEDRAAAILRANPYLREFVVFGPVPSPSLLSSQLSPLQKHLMKQGDPSDLNREIINKLKRKRGD